MTNQPNKATVKDGLPTAEEATMVAMESAYKKEKSVGNILDINSAVAFKLGWGHAIQHASLHTQALRDRVKELEGKITLFENTLQERINYLKSINRTACGDGALSALERIKEVLK